MDRPRKTLEPRKKSDRRGAIKQAARRAEVFRLVWRLLSDPACSKSSQKENSWKPARVAASFLMLLFTTYALLDAHVLADLLRIVPRAWLSRVIPYRLEFPGLTASSAAPISVSVELWPPKDPLH